MSQKRTGVHVNGGSYKIIHRHYLHGVSRSNPHIHLQRTRKPHEPHEVAACQKVGCAVTSSVLQGGFVRNQDGLKRHPVCSSVGAPCRNQRIFCARKAILLLLAWAARKGQFAALSDGIMNLNVSCRKRFLLASERRIVGRVSTDRIIGFVFRAVL